MRLDDDLKYFESSEFKDILATYETACEAGSQPYMEADELTDIAEYYSMVCHDDERAEEAITLALQLHPDAVDPQVFKARQFMQAGELGTAEDLCNAIEDQQDREVIFLRAELMVREERVEEAATMLLQIAFTIKEDSDYFLYDSAYIFIDYHIYDQALVFANQLVQIAPDWYKTWQVMADTNLGLNNNRVALTYIERMLDVDPFSTESWNWRAEAYCELGEYPEALNSTEYALAIDAQNERATQLKAWVLLQQEHYPEALALYERLIEWSPDNEQNWLYASYCLLDADRVEEALAAIEKAEALAQGMSSEQAVIYEQHAQILSRKGDVEGALENLDKAQTYFEPDADVLDLDLLRARVEAENERPDLALDYIQQAYHHHEDEHLVVYFQGALTLFDCGYYEIARDMLLELLKHDEAPRHQAEYYAYLAYCSMMLEQSEKTLDYLQLAMPMGEDKLRELFSDEFPNVQPAEYYDYYYYRIHNQWPSYPPF